MHVNKVTSLISSASNIQPTVFVAIFRGDKKKLSYLGYVIFICKGSL